MKLSLYTNDLLDAPVDLLALGVFSDEADRGIAFSSLNRALSGALDRACRDEQFEGRRGQLLTYNVSEGLKAHRIVLYGYGLKADYDGARSREFADRIAKVAQNVGAASCALALAIREVPAVPENIAKLVQGLADGILCGNYQFSGYLTKEQKPSRLKEMKVAFSADDVRGIKGSMLRDALAKGRVIAAATCSARDLVNEPANTLTPKNLASRCKKMCKTQDLEIKVLSVRDLEKQKMNLLLAVGQGSSQEPCLIHMTYRPEKSSSSKARSIALVGKGLTYDSGGLSLKPTDSMVTMKCDMGGAAAVYGAMQAIANLKPDCVVHGIIPAAENMPGGGSFRPGDILKSKNGLTVEVMNTDAEGRLVLADAISYALDQKPKEMIDLATLTGACVVALGQHTAGAYIASEEMAADLAKAWQCSGEKFWRMPLDQELAKQLKSDIADLKNLGTRWGGSITAALFLQAFVGEDFTRWAHLDIAGPVMAKAESGKGDQTATGFGVRTCVEYILALAERSGTASALS
jgi:leucyl aminopeptidase